MSSRTLKISIGVGIGLFLAGGIFSAGLVAGASFQGIREGAHVLLPSVFPAPISLTAPPLNSDLLSPEETQDLFRPFWETWEIVQNQFVDQPVDDLELMRGAIQGMLDSLGDSATGYMDPNEYFQANSQLEGEYEGIGVWVDADVEFLTVISTIPGSPAEEAGLLPGDEILEVDGEDMTGIDGNLVIRRVLGPAGTSVRLLIRRQDLLEPFEVEIVRQRILIPTLESDILEGNIVYIKLFGFGEKVSEEFHDALKTLITDDSVGVILDLRGNPGGLLNASVDVASEFLDGEIVLRERFAGERIEVHQATEGGLATEIPLVVLINGGSASASEIVAGAIQDHDRGILIGETSFGKGTVQNWIQLEDESGAVRVTIARWFTPGDRQIDEIGLEPDIEILHLDESNEIDLQLEKAIEILLN